MTSRLRKPSHFLYYDTNVTESYLAYFAGGLSEGGSRADKTSENESRNYRLAGISAEASSEKAEQFRPTAVFMFDFLYKELDEEVEEERILAQVDSLDEQEWLALRNDDIVEITGTVKIPEVIKAIEVLQGFGRFLPALESLGTSGQIPMNEEDHAMMGGISLLNELAGLEEAKNTVVIVEPIGSPSYRFVARLDNHEGVAVQGFGNIEGTRHRLPVRPFRRGTFCQKE